MNPKILTTGRMLLALLVLGVSLVLVSWDFKQTPGQYKQSFTNDTIPKSKSTDREKKIRNLDDVLDEVNAVDLKMEMDKAQKEITEAMKEVDAAKLKALIDKELASVVFDKIRRETEASIAKIDGEKLKAELANAIK